MEEKVKPVVELATKFATMYGPGIVKAILILVIGVWAAKIARRLINKLFDKTDFDPILEKFVSNLVYYLLYVIVILAALNAVGVQLTALIAVMGAAGLAIGFALQGSLSNFAAGLLMLVFRPFSAGHYIEGAGSAGTVESIQVFTTKLRTPDNKLVIVPNAKLMGDNIINYSAMPIRRVDFTVGVSYSDDLQKVRNVLMDIFTNDERVHKDPAPFVAVSELADSSVNFVTRVWANTEDYWSLYFDSLEKIKTRFDAEGISIPFPQQDVNWFNRTEEPKPVEEPAPKTKAKPRATTRSKRGAKGTKASKAARSAAAARAANPEDEE
jgi:small conductance mechanosensitive channel